MERQDRDRAEKQCGLKGGKMKRTRLKRSSKTRGVARLKPKAIPVKPIVATGSILLVILSLNASFLGCGAKSGEQGASSEPQDSSGESLVGDDGDQVKTGRLSTPSTHRSPQSAAEAIVAEPVFPTENTQPRNTDGSPRILGDLLEQASQQGLPVPRPVDEASVRAAGIMKLEGQFIDLYTDLRSDEVAEYVTVFDQAVVQLAEYFGTSNVTPEQFHVRGCLMQERERFSRVGLMPEDLPPFQNGFQRDAELWVLPKPGDYYTRHLLLHEGTHAYMRLLGDGVGPPWYMEGMAELIACHRWDGEQLELHYTIKSRAEAPYFGRVKIIRDGYREGRALSLEEVFRYPWRAYLETEPYGWSWAACAFLDGHPASATLFRSYAKNAGDQSITFSNRLIAELEEAWPQFREEWQLFVAEMDYGYDLDRSAVRYSNGATQSNFAKSLEIHADAGWQSTGLMLEAGRSYRISATGQVQVAETAKPWISEANGITIQYYRGIPLGALIGAVQVEPNVASGEPTNYVSPLISPMRIGNEHQFVAEQTGILFLRVNDSPASLWDNSGEYFVELKTL